MKITQKTGASLVVLLGIFLLTISAYAAEYEDGSFGICESCWRTIFSIADPQPAMNLIDAKALWDYRDTGEYQNTGAYYQVYVAVKLGGKLLDYNSVRQCQ